MPSSSFSPLKYLMAELGIKSGEYSGLSAKDKQDLKDWANEEADLLGL